MQSIAISLLEEYFRENRNIKKLKFISIFREANMI